MNKISKDNFRDVIASSKPVVVDFWAQWCSPCRMLSPIMDELSEEMKDKVDIYKCDVDEFPDIAASFNVRSIPTLILFKNSDIVDISTGAASKATVKEWIESKI